MTESPPRLPTFALLPLWLLLTACSSAAARPNQATQAAQVLRSQQLATRMAVSLQSTAQSVNLQATATAQAYQELFTEAQGWEVFFPGSFAGTRDAWVTGDETNEYGSSKWAISGDKLNWEASAAQGMVWWSIPDMAACGDFFLSARMQQVDGPPDSLMGLAFRVTEDEKGYYLFQVDPQGDFAVYQLENDEWITLLPWDSSSAFQAGQPNQLAVLGQQDHFLLFINSVLEGELVDGGLASGTAGLMIGLNNPGDSGTWEFEEFEVRIPPGSNAGVTLTP